MLLSRCFKWPITEGTTGADPTEEGAGGKMIWDDWDKTGKDFWNDTARFWTGDYDGPDWDIDSYESMKYWSSKPIFGSYAKSRAAQMENDENDRYWDDKLGHFGLSRDDVPYPIRSGMYSSHYDGFGTVEASQSVIDLYSLMKW